jgi:gluconate 2-dehydrogenase alpha chain
VDGLQSLTQPEALAVGAIFDRLYPVDDLDPGASEIGAVAYLDRALGGWLRSSLPRYRRGLATIDAASRNRWSGPFCAGSNQDQDALLKDLESGSLHEFAELDGPGFFNLLRSHCQEGLFADPVYGGNRTKSGWRAMRHPGIILEPSAAKSVSDVPVGNYGSPKSLADVADELSAQTHPDPELSNFDPLAGVHPPDGPVDVVLVGVGAVGGLIAPILAEAGLRVVGLEAGPLRSFREFIPDELGATYYCRQNLGPKFMAEEIQWRPNDQSPTEEPSYSLGRMMNNVGGSVIHYGAWLRRFHPQNFRMRSHIEEMWGEKAIPDGSTVADWPISYDDLEPYFTRLDHEIGIAGDDQNPFLRRSAGYPLPPTRPFRLGNLFTETTRAMGLHPHAVPVGYNTAPWNGFPEATYTAWDNGFGSWTGAKWHPGLTSVPRAMATGNFTLRTECRVMRILTNTDGKATGVEYVNAQGTVFQQLADTVILCSYTWENLRLLFLSADAMHPDGLGNNSGQLGKHLMIKMFAHVGGYFPVQTFNRHMGPAAQGVVLDDYLHEGFDSVAEGGFIGGMTLGAENQFLPIQIARESLPKDVPRWGIGYKQHLREWQHLGVVRAQPEALSYACNYADIDPRRRDKSGLGMPVIRVTYDLQENELRMASFFHEKADAILRAMGATKTWNGPDFTGAGSSHDLGGTRFGHDPNLNVLDRNLKVHDTEGLYVFGGSAMPTCPGINPTLTLWAMVYKAAEDLVATLKGANNT